MKKEFTPNGCPKIKLEVQILNNFGFIALSTKVYLDLQNGRSTDKPLFVTPPYLTDGSIPLTLDFKHYNGLLFIRHILSYGAMPGGIAEAEEAAKKLKFNYRIINSCDGTASDYRQSDHGPEFIDGKKIVYFITSIDIL